MLPLLAYLVPFMEVAGVFCCYVLFVRCTGSVYLNNEKCLVKVALNNAVLVLCTRQYAGGSGGPYRNPASPKLKQDVDKNT